MTIAYKGELEWIGGGEYAPLIVDSLEIREQGRTLVISFRSQADRKDDGFPFSGIERARIVDVEPYKLPGLKHWVHRIRFGEPVYEMRGIALNRNISTEHIHLLWRIQELKSGDGLPYCYVEMCWIDKAEAATYECRGLLDGREPEDRPWHRNDSNRGSQNVW